MKNSSFVLLQFFKFLTAKKKKSLCRFSQQNNTFLNTNAPSFLLSLGGVIYRRKCSCGSCVFGLEIIPMTCCHTFANPPLKRLQPHPLTVWTVIHPSSRPEPGNRRCLFSKKHSESLSPGCLLDSHHRKKQKHFMFSYCSSYFRCIKNLKQIKFNPTILWIKNKEVPWKH